MGDTVIEIKDEKDAYISINALQSETSAVLSE
jgi:hypothetical protein